MFCLRSALIPAFCLLGAFASTSALADSWVVGLGAGFAERYTYRTLDFSFLSRPYEVRLGDAPIITVSATSSADGGLVLQTGIDAFRADSQEGLSAEMAAISAGPRWSPRGSGPYVELLPAIFFARWTDTHIGGFDFLPSNAPPYSLTSVRPGLIGGAGIRGFVHRAGFEFGVSYRASADWPGLAGEGEYQGVRQWVAGGKLLFRL